MPQMVRHFSLGVHVGSIEGPCGVHAVFSHMDLTWTIPTGPCGVHVIPLSVYVARGPHMDR